MTVGPNDKQTAAPSILIDGVRFHCYRTGILRYEWRSADGKICAGRNHNSQTYWAVFDGKAIGDRKKSKRFRSLKNALSAGVRAAIRDRMSAENAGACDDTAHQGVRS